MKIGFLLAMQLLIPRRKMGMRRVIEEYPCFAGHGTISTGIIFR